MNTFYALFAIPLGSLSDRIGKGKVIILGYLLFSLFSCVGWGRNPTNSDYTLSPARCMLYCYG